jgi:hypothetical protein
MINHLYPRQNGARLKRENGPHRLNLIHSENIIKMYLLFEGRFMALFLASLEVVGLRKFSMDLWLLPFPAFAANYLAVNISENEIME